MNAYFFDSSALIKRFTQETGSRWVLSLFKKSARNIIYISRITPVETVSGLAKQNRIGVLSGPSLDKSINRLMRRIEDKYFFIEINENLVALGISLVRKHGLRGFDAVQLAAAIKVMERRHSLGTAPPIFVSADSNLNRAALAEGFVVENPNQHN